MPNNPHLDTRADRLKVALTAAVDDITDQAEARARFLEEALELVQAAGGSIEEVRWQADRTFAQPVDPVALEVGQVVTALHRIGIAYGVDVTAEAERDCRHIEAHGGAIRERHKRKERFHG